ncbi:MAG: hypothetical protein GTN78_06885, partial [Gemmatimonadales bacterium]|nr:hypothetical protein [Gemmatimonadales bacterium]
QLGVPVELVNVFGGSPLDAEGVNQDYLHAHAPVLLVGTGLALRELRRSKTARGQAREKAA